jgi:hypothetical protein
MSGDSWPVDASGVFALDAVVAEIERAVQGANRTGNLVGADQAGDLDR